MNVPETAIRLTVDAVVFGYRDRQLFVALNNLPALAFNHAQILQRALERPDLRAH